jgi:glycosyltransferase involved in cell wall biosynthesis
MGSAPVLYVLKRFPRLSETFVLRELLELEALGERILIDALLPPEEGPSHPELTQLKAEVRYLPRRPRVRHPAVARVHARHALRHPRRWLRIARRARRAGTWRRFLQAGLTAERIRGAGVRHVHAHFATAAAEVARDAAALAGVPFTVTAHAKDIFQRDNARLIPARVHGAAAVVTVSEFNAAHLRRAVPDVPVLHVPNGTPLGPPVEPHPDGAVLTVGRLIPKKGIDVLLAALALLAGEHDELRAEVIGGGPLAADLEADARTLGIADRVTFRGPQPSTEVQAALARCSLFALPCRVAPDGDRDGMPTVLLEAMARGVPAVSTAVAGIAEVVQDGRTGLLVAPDDPAALAGAILRLRRDPTLAGELGTRGRELVAERFDPGRSARILRELFQQRAR